MRILFSSLASHGHTFPLIPLALAARDAGHEVVFATGEDLLPSLHLAGLATAVAGIGIRAAFGEAAGGAIRRPQEVSEEDRNELMRQVFGVVLPRRFVADLAPVIAEHGPDLVVAEIGNPGAGIAARLAGVPVVTHAFGRGSAPGGGSFSDLIAGPLQTVYAELGLDAPAGPAVGATDRYLDIYPPSLQDPAFAASVPDRVLLRPVAYAEPGPLPAIVTAASDRPLVYLTLGTAFGSPDVLREAVTGLAGTGARVLVAAGPTVDPADLGELPAGVAVEAWVPQADVLPYADLVVHHGGSGTTLGALAAGVPQLFLPQGADQFVNAEAVVAAGAGSAVAPDACSADAVGLQAKALLADEEVRRAAARVAQEIARMPSPAEIARRLPELG